jgi:hypothetical protein
MVKFTCPTVFNTYRSVYFERSNNLPQLGPIVAYLCGRFLDKYMRRVRKVKIHHV